MFLKMPSRYSSISYLSGYLSPYGVRDLITEIILLSHPVECSRVATHKILQSLAGIETQRHRSWPVVYFAFRVWIKIMQNNLNCQPLCVTKQLIMPIWVFLNVFFNNTRISQCVLISQPLIKQVGSEFNAFIVTLRNLAS